MVALATGQAAASAPQSLSPAGCILANSQAMPVSITISEVVVLSGERKFAWTSLLFLLSALLTQAAYPFLWSALKQASAIPVGILLLRDATLGLLCMLLIQGPPKPDVPELNSGTS